MMSSRFIAQAADYGDNGSTDAFADHQQHDAQPRKTRQLYAEFTADRQFESCGADQFDTALAQVSNEFTTRVAAQMEVQVLGPVAAEHLFPGATKVFSESGKARRVRNRKEQMSTDLQRSDKLRHEAHVVR